MKTIFMFVVMSIWINGCDQSTSPSNEPYDIKFTLSDTNGQAVSQFHSGEEFKLMYSLTNATKDTLTYTLGSTAPPISFKIMKNDSIIASSEDGYAYLAILIRGSIAPGQSLQGEWKAPTTPAQRPQVVLNPGSYEAEVNIPIFNQVKVNPVSSIKFTVVQ